MLASKRTEAQPRPTNARRLISGVPIRRIVPITLVMITRTCSIRWAYTPRDRDTTKYIHGGDFDVRPIADNTPRLGVERRFPTRYRKIFSGPPDVTIARWRAKVELFGAHAPPAKERPHHPRPPNPTLMRRQITGTPIRRIVTITPVIPTLAYSTRRVYTVRDKTTTTHIQGEESEVQHIDNNTIRRSSESRCSFERRELLRIVHNAPLGRWLADQSFPWPTRTYRPTNLGRARVLRRGP